MKLQDWSIRFDALIRARQSMPFEWGANDCCTFAADCVQAMTGIDCAASLRGHSTAKQAYRSLRKNGGVIGIATAALGQPVSAVFAKVGDVVLSKAGKHDMLAICNGTTALAPSASGLISIALGDLCWRIL